MGIFVYSEMTVTINELFPTGIKQDWTCVFLFVFLGMPNSKMSLQPQRTESLRTTAQSWESESAVTFSVELPSLITECSSPG